MRKREKVGWALVTMVVVGLILPIIFGKPRDVAGTKPGDAWRDTIYDFQTLITGVFAVAAAFVTVRQMQATDASAQLRHDQLMAGSRQNEKEARERHNELVELTVRKDRLMVERLLFPYLNALEFQASEMAHSSLWLPAFEKVDDPALQPIAKQAEKMIAPMHAITNIIIQPPWRDASPLLDGITSFHVQRMHEFALMCIDLSRQIQNYIVPPREIDDDDDLDFISRRAHSKSMEGKSGHTLEFLANGYNHNVAALISELNSVIAGLEKLKSLYGLNF
ncbi:hypothetical protein GYN07_16505 [Rhizobium leguminosarum bv. viciae 248]|uniref:hypothetical protein n=1 Tax=Rhizobium leguminosarum TaxID=384 RepID=UPI00037C8370|nr:hypothetical protein [Rhizobium leguminosarum]QHW25843.1 hypothetical protein GYN07_16505 [Rhizobium leguminosarum bv. viciae 248]